jgi:hypothetical protein
MRWDGDERGRGIGDATALAPGAEELVRALHERGWVAEDADAHLLPHLRAAVAELPLELVRADQRDDGAYVVELTWQGEPRDLRGARAAVFSLLGAVAETATYVRQRRNDALEFEVATGILGDGAVAPHGHVLLVRVAGVI